MTLTQCDNCGKVVRSAFKCSTETTTKYYSFDLCKDCLDAILTKREKLEKERDEAARANCNDV